MQLEDFARIGFLFVVGMLAALADSFYTEDDIGTRRLLGKVVGGGLSAVLLAGAIFHFQPGLKEDLIMLASIGVLSGFLGYSFITRLARSGIQSVYERTLQPESKARESGKKKPKFDDSGEFDKEELARMQRAYLEKISQKKAQDK